MKVNEVDFLGSFPGLAAISVKSLPAVAIVGRSNVGKSSFINHMLNRKKLAKTSSTPGKTQLINIFEINGKFHFIDLPGYGFAKVPVAVKKSWKLMISDFLWNYPSLKMIIQLVDIRHKPSNEDLEFNAVFKEADVRLEVIANKSDKIKKSQIKKQLGMIQTSLDLPALPIQHSIHSTETRGALWQNIHSTLFNHF